MKKIIMINILAILLIIGLLLIINKKNIYTEIDGIKYAILVDGTSTTAFPNGDYKVDVSCANAYGYWDSILNKLIVKNINGDVTCSIKFTSITSDDYINNYITNLSGTTQGNGKVIHESFSPVTSSSEWQKVAMTYENTSGSAMMFNNNEYVGTTSTSTGSSYHKFYPQTNGYYRICYNIPSSAYSTNTSIYKNYIGLYYLNNTNSEAHRVYSNYNNGDTITDCYDYEYITTSDFMYIRDYYYDQNITIYFEKAINNSNVYLGYRYEGVNPNNYIMFNNELWRIVGVFDSTSHGQNEKNLVKIVRNESIGGLSWNKESNNNWTSSALYNLLNEQYYDWEENKNNVDNNCYLHSTIIGHCDYSIKGIKDEYRPMIENVMWYLGGGGKTGFTNYTPYNIYNYERNSDAIYDGNNISESGYIGLLYASDYVYGVLESDCSRVNNATYDNSECTTNNWLYSQGQEWLITPTSNDNTHAWTIDTSGNLSSNYQCFTSKSVRPVVYLSPNVYRVSGTGSITDPYIIGLAS